MRLKITLLFCFVFNFTFSQDSIYLKVHFLYGSRPVAKYICTEKLWFGGIHGGHVGIEGADDSIINFRPNGSFHLFSSEHYKHSMFDVHSADNFYSILGGEPDNVKEAIIYIPINAEQKNMFDSITSHYIQQTPYDYAFLGMRCGAAAYDILSQLNILPGCSYGVMYRKIFYPQKLRRRLLKNAQDKGWKTERQKGSVKRTWERD